MMWNIQRGDIGLYDCIGSHRLTLRESVYFKTKVQRSEYKVSNKETS